MPCALYICSFIKLLNQVHILDLENHKRLVKKGLLFGAILFVLLLPICRFNPLPAAIIAAMTGYAIVMLGAKYKHRVQKKYGFLAQEDDLSNAFMVLIAAMIHADDKKTDSEYRYIEKALLDYFTIEQTHAIIDRIKKKPNTKLKIKELCRFITLEYSIPDKIQFLHLLMGIATADGLLTKTEHEMLKEIAIGLKIPHNTFQWMFNMFHFVHEGHSRHEQKKVYSSKLRLSEAFKLLDLPEDATVNQIKKAYRKLALKHHPDRVIHLDEAFQIAAKEKFQLISEAYEYIKSKKNFS